MKKDKKIKKHKCYSCEKMFPKNEISFRTNPYWVEIKDDYDKGWLCDNCAEEFAEDI